VADWRFDSGKVFGAEGRFSCGCGKSDGLVADFSRARENREGKSSPEVVRGTMPLANDVHRRRGGGCLGSLGARDTMKPVWSGGAAGGPNSTKADVRFDPPAFSIVSAAMLNHLSLVGGVQGVGRLVNPRLTLSVRILDRGFSVPQTGRIACSG